MLRRTLSGNSPIKTKILKRDSFINLFLTFYLHVPMSKVVIIIVFFICRIYALIFNLKPIYLVSFMLVTL